MVCLVTAASRSSPESYAYAIGCYRLYKLVKSQVIGQYKGTDEGKETTELHKASRQLPTTHPPTRCVYHFQRKKDKDNAKGRKLVDLHVRRVQRRPFRANSLTSSTSQGVII
jgi:hypothetical protein